jgi:hypothetical protein
MTDHKGIDITLAADAAKVEDEGQVVHLRGRDGELLYFANGTEAQKPVTITVVGTYSTVYRSALNRQRDRLVKMRRAKLTGDMVEEQQLDLMAACVLGWDGFFVGERPVPFTRENVKQVLATVPWIREQVDEAMSDHEGFTKGSSPTS